MRKAIFLLFLFISLVASAQNSQVKVSLKNGTTIEGEVKELDALDHITIIVGGVETTIPMSQVEYVSNIEEESEITTEYVDESIPETTQIITESQEDPLKDFKGFLLAKGNNVYVEYSNSDGDSNAEYDKEGALVIRTLLKKDGFWNVVEKKNHAHFVIHYRVITKKRDKSELTIYSPITRRTYFWNTKRTNESILKNNKVAHRYYYKIIEPLQKKIENGNPPKMMVKDFTVK